MRSLKREDLFHCLGVNLPKWVYLDLCQELLGGREWTWECGLRPGRRIGKDGHSSHDNLSHENIGSS